MKRVPCIFLLALAATAPSQQTKPQPKSPPARRTPTFTERLLEFLGIADTPGTLKAPDDLKSGTLWLANLDTNTTRPLSDTAGFRSPVFLSGTGSILALHGEDVVRFSTQGGEGTRLYAVDGILKLVGSASDDPNQALVLLHPQTGTHPRVALLTIATGAITLVPYNPASNEDLQMLENLEGWSRTYAGDSIFVKRLTKQALSGTVEWTDVFLKRANQPELDVSQCDGVQCGQPSLSNDGHWLSFIKAPVE